MGTSDLRPDATAAQPAGEGPAGEGPAAGASPASDVTRGVSRRRVLQAAALLVPGVVGAGIAGDLLATQAWASTASGKPGGLTPPGGGTTPADDQVAPAEYDPTQHRWAFVCNTTTCIGCGHCVVACKAENGVPADAEHTRTWIELHVVGQDGTVRVESPEAGIAGFDADEANALAAGFSVSQAYFVPRLCMQCENPPCVNVCPVSATYRNVDGVTLVDEQRCIGCGYCMVACPYGARYIVPNGGPAPKGVAGVVDKCTFCYHRITKGLQPACVEVCPVGARVFGDLNDPESAVNRILQSQRTEVMKPTLGTRPRVHFVGMESEVG